MKLELDWKGIAKKATAAVAGGLVVAAVTFSAPVHASDAYDYWAYDNMIKRCFSGTQNPDVNWLGGAGCVSAENYKYLQSQVMPLVQGIRTKGNDTYAQVRSNSTVIGEIRLGTNTLRETVDALGATVDGIRTKGNDTYVQVRSNSTAIGGIRESVKGVDGSISAESQRIVAEVNEIGGALGTLESSMMDRFDRLASDWPGGGGSGSAEDAALAAQQRQEVIKGLRVQARDCYEDQPSGLPWWASMQPRDTLGVPCSLFERTAERLSEFFKRKEAEDVAREALKEKRLELEEERRHQEAQEQRERMQAAEEVAAQRQADRDAAESAEAKAREAAAERRHQELKKAVEDAANERSAAETAADQARRDLQEEVSGLSDAVKSGFGDLGDKIDGLGEAIRGIGSGGTSGPAIGAAPGVRSVKPTNLDGWKSLSSCVVVAPPKQGLCGAGPEFNFFGTKVKPLSYCGDMSAIRATVSFIGWVIVFAAAWMAFRWMLAAYGVAAPSEKSG